MAGYSMVSYLFQWKDRHNGNLLLDEEGHIVHIDFNFMLAHSPGGINFESAPFKLTRELLEVMDTDPEGSSSDAFNYFKVLCIQGFLAARKHADRILLLAEMMQGSNMPCFKGGVKVLHQLRRRFNLCATEEQCVELVLTLIGDRCAHAPPRRLRPISRTRCRACKPGRVEHAAIRLLPARDERYALHATSDQDFLP